MQRSAANNRRIRSGCADPYIPIFRWGYDLLLFFYVNYVKMNNNGVHLPFYLRCKNCSIK